MHEDKVDKVNDYDEITKILAKIGKPEPVDAINDFTRSRMREGSFMQRIMPPIPISNDDLDRSYPTDTPVKVVDR